MEAPGIRVFCAECKGQDGGGGSIINWVSFRTQSWGFGCFPSDAVNRSLQGAKQTLGELRAQVNLNFMPFLKISVCSWLEQVENPWGENLGEADFS